MASQNELMHVVTKEILKLEKKLIDVAGSVFDKPNYEQMVSEISTYLIASFDDDRCVSWEYLDTHNKMNCAWAAYSLEIARFSAVDGNFLEAISQINDASFFLGIASAYNTAIQEKTKVAQIKAFKSHLEDISSKKQAIEHYKANHMNYANKDKAAIHISENIVPYKFSTVRDWLKGVIPE